MHRAAWLTALLLVPTAGAQLWEDDVGDVASVLEVGNFPGEPQRTVGPALFDRGDIIWLHVHVEDAVIVSVHTNSELATTCGEPDYHDMIMVGYTFAGHPGFVYAYDHCDPRFETLRHGSGWKRPQGGTHDHPAEVIEEQGCVTYTWRLPLGAFWAVSNGPVDLSHWNVTRELSFSHWSGLLSTQHWSGQEDTAWWPESRVTLPARPGTAGAGSDEPTAAEPNPTHADPTPPTLFEALRQARQPPADQHEPAAFAAVGFAVMAAALLLRPRWSLAAAALFTRIREDRLTDHPRRARIIALVAACPGVSFSELRRALGTGSGAALHHLRMLERADRIRSLHVQGRTSYFIGGVPADPLHALHGTRRRIREILGRRPGLTQHQLAARIGITRETVGHHVRALVAEGLLHASRKGAIRYYPR